MGTLVVGVDGSDGARTALAWAHEAARLHADDLVVMTVLAPPAVLIGEAALGVQHRAEVERATTRRAAAMLDEMVAPYADAGVAIKPVVETAPAAFEALVERAAGSDGLVVGSRGLGAYRRMLLGSVSQQAVLHARSPVVVVPQPSQEGRRRDKVVVGIDGSPGARAALLRAAAEARLRGYELELAMVQPAPPLPDVHTPADAAIYAYLWTGVLPPSRLDDDARLRRQQVVDHWRQQAERQLSDELGRLDPRTLPDVVTRAVIGSGSPARALLDVAEWARLLVLGGHGHGGFRGMLLGSVSQHCVRHATAPVLVVPPGAP